MSQDHLARTRNEFHPTDPIVPLEGVLEVVAQKHPNCGPQAQLARILGVTRALVNVWSKREDGLVPPPWNWRIAAMFASDDESVWDAPEPTDEGAVEPAALAQE